MSTQVRGIVLDWAGTTVDYGCMAPVRVFFDIFRSRGIEPTLDEVRAPMGMLKRDHIRTMLDMPRLAGLFAARFGRPHADADAEAMHDEFEPKLLAILPDFTEPLPGAANVVERLRRDGLKIGATTGYNDVMMRIVAEGAGKRGYAPDCWLTPDAVGGRGRPYPYMIYANMIRLDMGMPWQVIKVGDTASDMEEARNAGVWAVGVVKGSSMLGLTEKETESLDGPALGAYAAAAEQRFRDSGAHYVIEQLSHLPDVIELVNRRIGKGERPGDISR